MSNHTRDDVGRRGQLGNGRSAKQLKAKKASEAAAAKRRAVSALLSLAPSFPLDESSVSLLSPPLPSSAFPNPPPPPSAPSLPLPHPPLPSSLSRKRRTPSAPSPSVNSVN